MAKGELQMSFLISNNKTQQVYGQGQPHLSKLFPRVTLKVIISGVWLSLMLYCKQNWEHGNIFISSAAIEQRLYITPYLATESWMNVCCRVLHVRSRRIHDSMDTVWQWLHHKVCVHGVSHIIHTQETIALCIPRWLWLHTYKEEDSWVWV